MKSRVASLSGIQLLFIAAMLALPLATTGCGAQAPSGPPAPATVEAPPAAAVASTTPPAVEATPVPVPAPKVKPGTIVIRGSGPTMFGPYTFKRGGYTFKFEQIVADGMDFNETSLVISLESKPGEVDSPFQILSNTSKMKGTNQVYVSGKLWVDVSFSGNDYVLTFTPKGK